ncbi:hormogonium polysaccharide biosynthesis glycosyltransferase HpsE [Leptothoe kymatousa]|uniref:Glycosyltransferase n=1 Tax=Leptothoe kymatousa TAU-MAC 1615 TaxID=2364775 RepID=A0ABS5Y1M8_9CYAN|nr:hormogonium polysaccharide biosynthesis glycosyltransferase HpsE [Leptothoe kymatousa]MBT9311506.1 glycosyltransferase [Leptothoe kymatousa TAU-MAC 1615]
MASHSTVTVSVILPTYNGAQRIPAVLQRLSQQVVAANISWNIWVVDNNSSDDTAAVVQQYQRQWSACPLNYVFEPRQGLAYARQCGIDSSDGALVAFLDDDNWPPADWVNQVAEFGRGYPRAGAFGGRIAGVFEGDTLPEDVEPLLGFLAIRDRGETPHPYPIEQLQFPPGAGLAVRRDAWEQCIPPVLVRNTRGADDSEISWRMVKAGWEVWYNPYTTIEHFIPQSRLQRAYLRALTHSYGLCTCDLLMIEALPWQRPILLLKSALGSLKRIFKHLVKYRHRSVATVEADCLLSFHVGNLKSPFWYLSKQFFSVSKSNA